MTTFKFNSFEEAASKALTIDKIKQKVENGENIFMYMVTALAPHSSIKVAATNKNFINDYKFSDIGEQIGYIIMDQYPETNGSKSRSFTSDIGLNDNNRYNRHLVFETKDDADAYMEFVKTSTLLIIEHENHIEECNRFDDYYSDYNIDY